MAMSEIEFEMVRLRVSFSCRPAILRCKCTCGGGGRGDWIIKSDRAVCAHCSKTQHGEFFAVIPGLCTCGGGGFSDWLVAPNKVVDANCGKTHRGTVVAYIEKGPNCSCGGGGRSTWFVTDDEKWICSNCGKAR
jgi:hypothetical protein